LILIVNESLDLLLLLQYLSLEIEYNFNKVRARKSQPKYFE